jgi:hypothetical protein
LIEVFAIVLVALGLGYLGWVLPSVGGSLLSPALSVFGVGFASAVAGGLFLWRMEAARRLPKVFLIGTGVVAVLAAIWTFQLSLPLAVWTSNASEQAEAALSQLEHSPLDHQGVVPPSSCVEQTAGGVGPLSAPYRECAIWTPQGHFVTFTGKHSEGLGFTNAGAATFPGKCVHHLVGQWWMFTGGSDPGWATGCPIGYQFEGGG